MDINNDPADAGQTTPPPSPGPGPNDGPSSPHSNSGMAIIAYLGILVIIPLLTEAKNDPFVKFHIKQGLVLLIGFLIASFVTAIPVLGWFIGPLIWLGCIILMIIGIMNASSGKQAELPVIGHFASNFHF